MWNIIENQLKSLLDNKSVSYMIYYSGGGLYFDIPLCKSDRFDKLIMCLHLNGIVYLFNKKEYWSEMQPEYINKLVQKVYLKVKGDTDYLVNKSFEALMKYSYEDYFFSIEEKLSLTV